MPVKIRCRGCEKILNAPDKARGKVIQCPKCGTKLKVPAAQGEGTSQPAGAKPAAQQQPPSRKPAVKSSSKRPVKTASSSLSDDDLFANLDIGHAEDTESRICPYCATELEEENDICPGCGMNVALGQMDRREAKRRSRKGPDSRKFYKEAWTESLAFVKKHKDLALRTGWYLAVFVVLSFACLFMYNYCVKGPPKFFWACCTFISIMGLPGWFFFLSMKIVDYSMGRLDKMDRIHFDFFQCVTLGMRTIFWPAVMLIPFAPLIAVVALMGTASGHHTATAVLLGCLAVFPLLALPLAIVHMTAPYTYKAWILWELVKVFVKNIAPALYWVLMALAVFIIPFGLVFGAIQLFGDGLNPFYNEHFLGLTEKMIAWGFGLLGEAPEGWLFSTILTVTRFALAFVVTAPLFVVAGFPLVFLMRANGLLGYYRQNDLDLVLMMAKNTPAGFWVRMLAFLVDVMLFPLASILVTKEKSVLMIAHFINAIGLVMFIFSKMYESFGNAVMYMAPLWTLYMWWMYFCVQESTSQRRTIGKDGFGLIVSTENNKQLTLQGASVRFFCSLLTVMTAFMGFVMCAFHPQKKALHDIVSKTKVVWEGDK